ncbi:MULTISPECIES: hypothetical protein [unclassified Ensifer]|uniref:hypothetical protein n=1 Tax=unclassified Ensifer TaxID=2633371 RepID=UPI0008130F7A|nr:MULTISPECIES: hypothetical protein [unclassified Ensifer]OCP22445.1 hypothetical protein BC361_24645 [Ensifer sp. LC54]OCP22655.1 hypothetical protein BC363_26780 [Ensifer sp. LC384]
MFKTEALSPMRAGRLNAALDRQYRFDGIVKPLRSHIENLAASGPLELTEGDGMIDYSRTRFNRFASHKEQDAYIARLRAKRYFYVNGWVVPKLVYNAIRR